MTAPLDDRPTPFGHLFTPPRIRDGRYFRKLISADDAARVKAKGG